MNLRSSVHYDGETNDLVLLRDRLPDHENPTALCWRLKTGVSNRVLELSGGSNEPHRIEIGFSPSPPHQTDPDETHANALPREFRHHFLQKPSPDCCYSRLM